MHTTAHHAAVSRARRTGGAILAVGGSAALTAALAPARDSLSLASVELLYLPVVVGAAVVGGAWPGLIAAVASDLLLNYFFIPPFHTFVVAQTDHVIALIVYVLVAAAVSVIVEIAARQRAAAERTRVEVRLLARATARPIAEQSLPQMLDTVREAFGFSSVAVRCGGDELERAGVPGDGDSAIEAAGSDRVRLIGTGPATLGADRRLLGQFAGAAARIVESRELAEQAAQARELAEIDRLRSALLAAVGHDLRTPLAGIKAAVSSLRDPAVTWTDADRDELQATIEESADNLDALVANLLAMSRVQAGVLSVHLQPTSVEQVCAKAALGTPAVVEVPDDLFVRADPGLLERTLANLVGNATRFSETVVIGADVTHDEVQITVVDHGPGIASADRDRIFEPFQRFDDHTTHTGTGLGLAIVRGFTAAMAGTVEPSDTPGGGLTMTLTLPAA